MKDFMDIENNEIGVQGRTKDRAYEKVVHFVKEKIKSNELKIGDKLPTERELVPFLLLISANQLIPDYEFRPGVSLLLSFPQSFLLIQ